MEIVDLKHVADVVFGISWLASLSHIWHGEGGTKNVWIVGKNSMDVYTSLLAPVFGCQYTSGCLYRHLLAHDACYARGGLMGFTICCERVGVASSKYRTVQSWAVAPFNTVHDVTEP